MTLPAPLRITSAHNPRIAAVVALSEQRERRRTGLFVAEGRRAVTRALAAGLKLRELYLCPTLGPALTPDFAHVGDAAVFEVTDTLLRKMAYQENPEGVLGVFEQAGRTLADFPRAPERPGPPGLGPPSAAGHADLFLVAVGLAKPGNLGAMARTAEAAGATGLLVADSVVDVYNPNAIRASTGAVFTLPVAAAASEEVRRFLRDRGVRIIAAAPGAIQPYDQVDLTAPVALVIGAEDAGLDEAWLNAGQNVRIPMHAAAVDSLNAGVAGAVLLFEAVRQRRARAGEPGGQD
jgi:TrmH family RNA methyltransferase